MCSQWFAEQIAYTDNIDVLYPELDNLDISDIAIANFLAWSKIRSEAIVFYDKGLFREFVRLFINKDLTARGWIRFVAFVEEYPNSYVTRMIKIIGNPPQDTLASALKKLCKYS